ncbi:putative ribonuclease H protein, partial [Trifolium medium]|nr:putative ribonuclease H protein [Trifolium medium]
QTWINFNMNISWNSEVKWKDYWAIACRCLWYWRNKEVHDENFNRPTYTGQHVLKLTREYRLAANVNNMISETPREAVLIRWKPPEEGWVKLNTDGSCKENGMAGCGA